MRDRIDFMIQSVRFFADKADGGLSIYRVRDDYIDSFSDDSESMSRSTKDIFLVNAADHVSRLMYDHVRELVLSHVEKCGWVWPDDNNCNAVVTHLGFAIPADIRPEGRKANIYAKSFVEIINAGWQAYFNESLWSDRKYAALRSLKMHFISELVLKSTEVLEFNYLQATGVSSKSHKA